MKRDDLLKAIKADLNDRRGKSKRISKRTPVECTAGRVINGCTVHFDPSKDELYLRTIGNIENYEEADITNNGLQAIAEDLGVFVIEESAPEIVRSEDLDYSWDGCLDRIKAVKGEIVPVTERMYNEMLNSMPPVNFSKYSFQNSEPYSHDNDGRAVLFSFFQYADRYFGALMTCKQFNETTVKDLADADIKYSEPKGKRFNDLLCTIATEYAEKFGYTKVKDSIWDRESDPHPFSQLANAPLRELRFDGESEREDGKYVPHIKVRQRFGSPRLDMYYPKEGNKGKSAFVGLEFNTDGSFSEAQVFYSPGVELFPKLLAEVQKRWEEIR